MAEFPTIVVALEGYEQCRRYRSQLRTLIEQMTEVLDKLDHVSDVMVVDRLSAPTESPPPDSSG